MKTKSLPIGNADCGKPNRVFDFVHLYKNPSNSSASTSGGLLSDTHESISHNVKSESKKRERSPQKRKKSGKREPGDISQFNDDPGNSSLSGPSLNMTRVTSTPLADRKEGKSSKVKSIMKHSVTNDNTMETDVEISYVKPKKRNKSVSFMLDDKEEVLNKKTKSDESTDNSKSDLSTVKGFKVKRKFKKSKKDKLSEKENLVDMNQQMPETSAPIKEKKNKKLTKSETLNSSDGEPIANQTEVEYTDHNIKKKYKKQKKVKIPKSLATTKDNATENANQEVTENNKKTKKKKHQDKPQFDTEEPVSKARKQETKPDVVTELENLSIGDNAHTLTNLLDEMTVVDKEKRKKLKHKSKNKKSKGGDKSAEPKSTIEPKSTAEPSTSDEVQEKVKWMRRKWNKDQKADKESLDNTVVIENVPLSLLLSYKKVLAEHYVKYGLVRSIGIVELYPSKVPAPVFTTTVNFYSDGAAQEALSDDWQVEGRSIKVKPSLPPTETTVAVRSYAPLSVSNISTALHGAGPIRDIRHAVKGKHSMSTFFVEFDGPASVENALKLATDLKIGGKKVYVSRFEVRTKKEKQARPNNEASDADHSDIQDNV